MRDADSNGPPAGPGLGRQTLPPIVVPVLLVILIAIIGILALGIRSSIDTVDRRVLKIENTLASVPAAEPSANSREPAERAAAPDKGLAESLKAIEEQVAATRTQVDAIRESIENLQKFANKAKDSGPGGFVADEMLVAQKGLLVKTTTPGGAASGGTRTWLATPSHEMLDLLLKVPPRRSAQILTLAPKQNNQVKSIDVYDRNSKGPTNKIADCHTENKRLRCKLNVAGPTILQVVAKTQSDEALDIELEPAS